MRNVHALVKTRVELGTRHAREQVRARLFRSPPVPVRVGRFTVVGERGSGGMGTVFAAHDPELDRMVAIKVLRDRGASKRVRSRLRREAQAMARISHPNVVPVFEIGLHERQLFIAMELVEGVPLDQWVRTRRPGVEEVVKAFIQAGRGLAAAHETGLVHRDFKPSNVLVARDGRVRVLDFGLACLADEPTSLGSGGVGSGSPVDGAVAPGLGDPVTLEGELLGTPAYMAPEQFENRPVDARTDQFAFCVALYEALHGRRPFRGDSLMALAEATCSGIPPADPWPTRIPRALRQVVIRGLSTDPTERYPSMHAVVTALEHALERPRTWRRPLWTGVVLATLVASALAGAFVPPLRDAVPSSHGAPSSERDPRDASRAPLRRVREDVEDDDLRGRLDARGAPERRPAGVV